MFTQRAEKAPRPHCLRGISEERVLDKARRRVHAGLLRLTSPRQQVECLLVEAAGAEMSTFLELGEALLTVGCAVRQRSFQSLERRLPTAGLVCRCPDHWERER